MRPRKTPIHPLRTVSCLAPSRYLSPGSLSAREVAAGLRPLRDFPPNAPGRVVSRHQPARLEVTDDADASATALTCHTRGAARIKPYKNPTTLKIPRAGRVNHPANRRGRDFDLLVGRDDHGTSGAAVNSVAASWRASARPKFAVHSQTWRTRIHWQTECSTWPSMTFKNSARCRSTQNGSESVSASAPSSAVGDFSGTREGLLGKRFVVEIALEINDLSIAHQRLVDVVRTNL